MNRRHFFQKLASGILVAAAPNLFIPKLIAPRWKQRVVALDELPEHSLAKLTTQLILMRNLDYMREAMEDYVIVAPRKWA